MLGILMSSYSQQSTLTPHKADSRERGEQSRHGGAVDWCTVIKVSAEQRGQWMTAVFS